MTYVLLGSRPGRYRSEAGDGLQIVEHWDYFFCGRLRASYHIAQLEAEARVRIIDEESEGSVNLVSTRLLEHFDTLQAARAALHALARFGTMDIRLEKRP